MRFLLRMAFWLGLVLVALPSAGSGPSPNVAVSTGEAMSAAKAAVDDMRQFCDRQAEACVVGSQAAVAIGQRAQAGAKMLYEFLNEHFGSGETGGTVGAQSPPLDSQNTLTAQDLAPTWRGPQPPRQRPGIKS
jgi:Family of unknown function (DUF5330)